MFEQFLSLLYSDHHDEVGGLLIRVVTDNGEFKYMGYIDSIRERPYLELEEGQVLGPGSPSEGGYRYQITEILSQDGYRLPLFYTQHGALGVVFQRDSLKPKVYTKKTPIEFIEELWRDTKVKLDGCFVSPLALIAVGEKHFKANDLARAEHYFLWADECADNTNVCQIRWNSSEESQTAYDNTLKSRRWTSLQHGSILESGDKKLTKAHINRFLGAIAFLQGEFQMSIQYVLTSIWHFGEYGDAFVDLARLHAAHGDAASAQLHINTAFRIDPKNPEIARVVEQINEELSIRGEKDQVMLPAN